jgi:hypothetical protein
MEDNGTPQCSLSLLCLLPLPSPPLDPYSGYLVDSTSFRKVYVACLLIGMNAGCALLIWAEALVSPYGLVLHTRSVWG